MQKIIPYLWFDKNAEEAALFYLSAFPGGRMISKTYYSEAGHEVHGMEAGTVLTIHFEVEGYEFVALNGGPYFTITPAISFMVTCPSKEEVDALWEKLSVGGKALMPLDTYPFSPRYGWVQDRFGVSWQIIMREGSKRHIVPSLLFTGDVAGKAEEAMQFYTSVFPDSGMGDMARYGKGQEPDKEGTLMYGEFMLAGQQFAAMDSAHGHKFGFNEGVSLLVLAKDQAEIDRYWEKLSAVKEAEQCGWLKDKYGVSWQVSPEDMEVMLNDPDRRKADRAMAAMLKMKKIDMAKLHAAYEGN